MEYIRRKGFTQSYCSKKEYWSGKFQKKKKKKKAEINEAGCSGHGDVESKEGRGARLVGCLKADHGLIAKQEILI